MISDRNWHFEELVGTVEFLHSLGIPTDVRRTVRFCQPTDSAVVLGSAQQLKEGFGELSLCDLSSHSRLTSSGVSVVRRRSGGGAVLVSESNLIWVDVLIPSDDPLWHDDVCKAFYWLGEVWRSALIEVGFDSNQVTLHQGALETSPWSREICFAGIGPGECLVEGRKVTGISQRRKRVGTLFQCMVNLSFDVERIVYLLKVDEPDQAIEYLKRSVGDIGIGSADEVRSAFKRKILEKSSL